MLQPIGDRVLVRPDVVERATKGGLLLHKLDEEKQYRGEIIKVGDGEAVSKYQAGQFLIYQRYGPAEVIYDNQKYVIVHLDEMLGLEVGESNE